MKTKEMSKFLFFFRKERSKNWNICDEQENCYIYLKLINFLYIIL